MIGHDFEGFLGLLREATRRVEAHYFQLPVAGAEAPIYRERVYCYELYHRLRQVMPNEWPYVLGGEVDKGGHPIIREGVGEAKPDFIVHVPGSMDRNLAVVEVKPVTSGQGAIVKDVRTLTRFTALAGYFGGVYLVYGSGDIKRFARAAERLGAGIHLAWHRQPGEPCDVLF